MMNWGGDFGMGFGGGGIFMIIFWGLIILGVVYILKALLRDGSKEEKKSAPVQEVLEMRFAKGEMSKEEFEDAIAVLKKNKE